MKIYLEPDLETLPIPCKNCKHRISESRLGEDEHGSYIKITSYSSYCERLRDYEKEFV